MDAGDGDLPQLVADLESGRLTEGRPSTVVLLLQEAVDESGSTKPTLGRVPGLSGYFVRVHEVGGRVRGNAILSTSALRTPHVIPLPQERQPRKAVVATVDVGGQPLFVVSVHLENRVSWWRGGLLSDSARGRQADALLLALPPSGHGIVGGDFNTWLGTSEPAWKKLLQRFPDPTGTKEQPTFRDKLVLDHLFLDLPREWHVERRVLAETYNSDHRPVLGVIRLRQRSDAPSTP